MKRRTKGIKFSRNLSYILSAAFVIAAIVMNLVPPTPARAVSSAGVAAVGNPGAIWTTLADCGLDSQDVNHFAIGEDVYINGSGFLANTSYDWDITGQPGGASTDPNIAVASGSFTTDASGAFCFFAYTVAADDGGEYSVKFGNKGDNYRVAGQDPVLGCTDPLALNYNSLATQDDGTCQFPNVDVCPNLDGSQAAIPVGFILDNNGNCVPLPPSPVPGCTDPLALNFNPLANLNNGTCQYPPIPVPGCMDDAALNYNPFATVNDQSCVYPPEPYAELTCFTLEFASFKLIVGNNGSTGEIGYSTDLDATIVSLGSIAGGSTVNLLVPAAATVLYLHPAALGGWGSPLSIPLSTVELRICEEDPMSLAPFCSYVDLNQPAGWTVTNLNAFPIEFTWEYGADASAAPIALAAGEAVSFTTASHGASFMNIFVNGFLLATDQQGQCPSFISLGLTAFCAANPAVEYGWTATNPNAFGVVAEWRVNGSLLAGLLNIPAGGSVNFTTPVAEGNIVQLYSGGIAQDDAGAAQTCIIPENPPETPNTPETPNVPIPVVSGGQVLIPVTGIADDLSGLLPVGLLSLSMSFLGIGLVLHGLSRRTGL